MERTASSICSLFLLISLATQTTCSFHIHHKVNDDKQCAVSDVDRKRHIFAKEVSCNDVEVDYIESIVSAKKTEVTQQKVYNPEKKVVRLHRSTPADPNLLAVRNQTLFKFESDLGDWVGGGENKTYTSPDARIFITGTLASFTLSVDYADDWWYVELGAPYNDTFRPGTYYNAERSAFRTGRASGLDFSGNGRGCNEIYGRITINQIEADENGNIVLLDATFVQNCETADAPAARGTIHYQMLPLSYSYSSETGDYIGLGGSDGYTGSTSLITLTGKPSTVISVVVSGKRSEWYLDFAPVKGEVLDVGTYEDAARYPFQEDDQPGLSVTGNGRGCNTLTGDFNITQLEVNDDGTVHIFSATLEQHCEDATPALTATVHYHD